jgi:hypothetical protein
MYDYDSEDSELNEPEDAASAVSSKLTVCARCFLAVARFAPQVVTGSAVYHRDCYETWYVRRYGRRPGLRSTGGHRFQVRDSGVSAGM